MKKDLSLFSSFCRDWNGVSLIPAGPCNKTIFVDACLSGIGAFDGQNAYAVDVSQLPCSKANISELEAANVAVALHSFITPEDVGTHVKILCDNLPSVQVFSTGRGKNQHILEVARMIWMIQAMYSLPLTFEHIAGKDNDLADNLSRAYASGPAADRVKDSIHDGNIRMIQPCTLANYRSAVRRYIRFCFKVNMDPAHPLYPLICAYIEELAEGSPSPRTVANNMPHIRTYLKKVDVPTQQMDHSRVKWAIDALKRDVSYVPQIKNPIPTDTLQSLVTSLPDTEVGNIIKVSVLVMFYAALCQSEVLAPSIKGYDHRFHLSRAVVTVCQDSIEVLIKHAKNMQTIYDQKRLSLQASTNPHTCVVATVHRMLQYTPTQHPTDPFIMFSDSRKPATLDFVRRRWNSHLIQNGVDVSHLSLHSLRKAAATAAHHEGCSEIQIQSYGGWKSNAHRTYIRPSQRIVNSAITHSLAQ